MLKRDLLYVSNMSARIVNKEKGFTLIELLIVLVIIGVLAVLVVGAINPLEQINKSRDAASEADASSLVQAVSSFYVTYGCNPWDYTVGAATPCASTATSFNGGAALAVGDAVVKAQIVDKLTDPTIKELKDVYWNRVKGQTAAPSATVYNNMWVSSVTAVPYPVSVCFVPSSKAYVGKKLYNGTGGAGSTHVCAKAG